ncbi:MAG: XRE family transcriptional regulator [Zoogloeaceae bacterium]|jgi:predicted XRE-type DNA-binding protein|nr:XRE family transcriptional regulator [Zoogloeaceae bacterium]
MSKMQEFESVWDALENTPAEAKNMKIRSRMMLDLKRHIKESGLTQEAAARLFGVTQPRISDLMRGKINRFSIDSLASMAADAGLRIDIRILSVA